MTDQNIFDYRYEYTTNDTRVFIMPEGGLGMERGGMVYIMSPDEWFRRVDAWTNEHMSARQQDDPRVLLAAAEAELSLCRAVIAAARCVITHRNRNECVKIDNALRDYDETMKVKQNDRA